MTNMKHLLLLCILLITFSSFANELSDAATAYQRGDYTTAFTICEKLAEEGLAEAQYNLGLMCKKGEGTSQDYKEAIKWFTKAAEQGHASAQYNLGLMYKKGDGAPQDYKEAIKWWTKAAKQGHASAQYNLGLWMRKHN